MISCLIICIQDSTNSGGDASIHVKKKSNPYYTSTVNYYKKESLLRSGPHKVRDREWIGGPLET